MTHTSPYNVRGDRKSVDNDEWLRHQRIQGAAYDMLAALKEFIKLEETGDSRMTTEAVNEARAAIAKAEGAQDEPPRDVNYDCDPIADQRMDASDFDAEGGEP